MTDWRADFLLIAIAFSLFGCSESSIVGKDLFGEEDFQVSYMDTLLLSLSTIRFDSLPTSDNARLLIGHMTNHLVGDVKAETYFLVSYSSTLADLITEDDSFDSLVLILPQDGYIYQNDDLLQQELMVEQLPVELEYRDNGQLYNVSEVIFSGEPVLLTRKGVQIAKDRSQAFRLRMPDDFGNDLFDYYKEEGELFDDPEFAEYMKGFRVVLDSTGEPSIIGLQSDSIRLELYYTNHAEVPAVQQTTEFYIGSSPHFAQISNQNIPASLSSLATYDDEVHSKDTDHISVWGPDLVMPQNWSSRICKIYCWMG